MKSIRIIDRINEFINSKMQPDNFMEQLRKANQHISLSFFRQNNITISFKESIDLNLLKLSINKILPNLFYIEPKFQLIHLMNFLKDYQFLDSKLSYALFQIKDILKKEGSNIAEFIFQNNLIKILYNYLLHELPIKVKLMIFQVISKINSIDYTLLQSTRENGFLLIYIKILEKETNALVSSKVLLVRLLKE